MSSASRSTLFEVLFQTGGAVCFTPQLLQIKCGSKYPPESMSENGQGNQGSRPYDPPRQLLCIFNSKEKTSSSVGNLVRGTDDGSWEI